MIDSKETSNNKTSSKHRGEVTPDGEHSSVLFFAETGRLPGYGNGNFSRKSRLTLPRYIT